jgi:hypothetical protein
MRARRGVVGLRNYSRKALQMSAVLVFVPFGQVRIGLLAQSAVFFDCGLVLFDLAFVILPVFSELATEAVELKFGLLLDTL